MLQTNFGIATTPAVNNALDIIEAELKPALTLAASRLNEVLTANPQDTAVVHGHLGDLHRLAARLDRNAANRQQHRANAR